MLRRRGRGGRRGARVFGQPAGCGRGRRTADGRRAHGGRDSAGVGGQTGRRAGWQAHGRLARGRHKASSSAALSPPSPARTYHNNIPNPTRGPRLGAPINNFPRNQGCKTPHHSSFQRVKDVDRRDPKLALVWPFFFGWVTRSTMLAGSAEDVCPGHRGARARTLKASTPTCTEGTYQPQLSNHLALDVKGNCLNSMP